MPRTVMAELSTKPYLIRAIHQWCEDSGYRPYLAVLVDERTHVPREFVRNGEIVLNVSAVATNRLQLGNELIEFEARFSGSVRQVSIPIENVSAIYAQETGHGMAFDVPKPLALAPERGTPESTGPKAVQTAGSPSPRTGSRPKLVPRPSQASESSGTEPREASATGAAVAASEPETESTSGQVPSGPAVADPATAPGSTPVLQAVDSTAPFGRAPRAVAPKSRRRGKLAAVPEGAQGEGGAPPADNVAGSPADHGAPLEPSVGPEATATSPPESSSTGPGPDEPPPSPPARPQLKRIK